LKTKFTKKQKELIASATSLFSQYGVKKVSVEEICKKASVSKMTYYKCFANKHKMVKTILAIMFESLIEEFEKIDHEDISFREKFDKMFSLEVKKIKEMGSDFFMEISNKEGDLYEIYSIEMSNYLEWFVKYYKNAQKRGDVRKNISINSIIFIIGQFEDLMNKPELIQMFPKYEDRMVELGNILLYGIVDKN